MPGENCSPFVTNFKLQCYYNDVELSVLEELYSHNTSRYGSIGSTSPSSDLGFFVFRFVSDVLEVDVHPPFKQQIAI